ncbi:OLC1v1033285C1 [Oldenlandia corymbosa var. corymbosa]|uniref:OLC1v1033285C1 n=1 Tax=Oldenlandia corymbosa var. corymbosa TaxID=529605 RepID=A0AAV1CQX9_OLDCO|nr:OLC1v1033285C1 [Oldenlandia corymbosa var. corymbosa]
MDRMVERSDLAALEFLMSKKPRGKVRIGAGNTIGARTSNIFDDLEKFQSRYALNKASSKESDIYWEAKASAVHAIRSVTNWLYWQTPPGGTTGQHFQNLTPSDKNSADPNIEKIRDVAEARKQARETMRHYPAVSSNYLTEGEYWDPSKHAFATSMMESESEMPSSASPSTKKKEKLPNKDPKDSKQNSEGQSFLWSVPLVFGVVAATIVRSRLGEGASGGLEEHIGGSRLRDIVNSNWLQVILAGVTWYLIGMAIMELVATIRSRLQNTRK